MNPNLSDPNPRDHKELMEFLQSQPEDQRHVALWVHPELANHLMQQIGHPHIVSHPMMAAATSSGQASNAGNRPFDLIRPRTGIAPGEGPGMVAVQPQPEAPVVNPPVVTGPPNRLDPSGNQPMPVGVGQVHRGPVGHPTGGPHGTPSVGGETSFAFGNVIRTGPPQQWSWGAAYPRPPSNQLR